jgi:bacterioferritin-associated ferredoxin
MIICVCKNVNSRQLKECLQKGMSLDDITEEMGLGTGCGRCLEYAFTVAEKEAPLIARERTAA